VIEENNDSTTKPCILLLDPDVVSRHPIAQYLRDCGYKVLEAVNTDEAMVILADNNHDVDVLLVDVAAPGKMNGFGIANWAKTNRPGMNVILVGTVANEAKEAGELCEKGPHLARPYHPQLLIDRIKRMSAARDMKGKPQSWIGSGRSTG
jgi:CheY-like chemotaxis protein